MNDEATHGRLPWWRPEDLNDEQKTYYDDLIAGPRGLSVVDPEGRLVGAFNSRLLDPEIGSAVQRLGASLRFGTALSAAERELVILEVAAAERCNYEWGAHSPLAESAGLTPQALTAIMRGDESADLFPGDLTAVRAVARRLLQDRDLDDAAFASAAEALGYRRLFAIVSLVGHYRHTAMSLQVWRVPLDPGMTAVFD